MSEEWLIMPDGDDAVAAWAIPVQDAVARLRTAIPEFDVEPVSRRGRTEAAGEALLPGIGLVQVSFGECLAVSGQLPKPSSRLAALVTKILHALPGPVKTLGWSEYHPETLVPLDPDPSERQVAAMLDSIA